MPLDVFLAVPKSWPVSSPRESHRRVRAHRTPASGACGMSGDAQGAGADGMEATTIIQSLDERLGNSGALEKEGVIDEIFQMPSASDVASEDPMKDLLTRKESELMQLRSRRVAELESRAERSSSELGELRARLASLREDFQYNLNLLDERDKELERYDASFARASTEAEASAKQLREARLGTQEAVSESRRWQQRCAESEAHHARRVAENRDVVERERFARDEALLRQREEFDAHKRSLMRQIAERDELLEVVRADAADKIAHEARKIREGVDVKKSDAESEASARKAKEETLERRVEDARRRASEAEAEAETARAAKSEAERLLSEARRASAEQQRQSDAQVEQLREKLETAERRGARLAEDADAASAAAAAAVRLAEAAAEDARQEALGAGLRRDAEHAAECAALAARGDALSTRADAAERALEETRAAARATRRELEERFAEASSADRVRDTSRAEDARADATRFAIERDEAIDTRREAERNVAASSSRETSLRDLVERLKLEGDSLKMALAAAHERAHAASRAAAETRAEAEHFANATAENARSRGDERSAKLANRIANLEAKLAVSERNAQTALREKDDARNDLESARVSFANRDRVRKDTELLAESVTANARTGGPPPLERADDASTGTSHETLASLRSQNEKLRESVSAMRGEMERLQRGMAHSAVSTPGSTPRLLQQHVPSMPPSLAASPMPREKYGGVSYEQRETQRHLTVELELSQSEVRRLTRDKEKLMEMSNGLRAELDRVSIQYQEATMDVFLDAQDRKSAHAKRNSENDVANFALTGRPPPETDERVKFDYIRGENVKNSDRATDSQKSALKKTIRQAEVRRVRNWNVKGDDEGGGVSVKDTTVIHQR